MPTTFNWSDFFNATTSFATVIAVIVALFGERIREHIFRAKPRLTIRDPKGIVTKLSGSDELIRYFHMKVETVSSTEILDSRVYLRSLEQGSIEGWSVRWTGDLPIKWEFEDQQTSRAIYPGAPKYVDLFSLDSAGLSLHPKFLPNTFRPHWTTPVELRLIVALVAPRIQVSTAAVLISVSNPGSRHIDGIFAPDVTVKIVQNDSLPRYHDLPALVH